MKADLVFSVSMLNEYANGIISTDPRLRSFKITGEIGSIKKHPSGHIYFVLKDSAAAVRCVMFRSAAATLKMEPVDGMQVIARCTAAIYPKDGQFQLYVEAMREQGEGDIYKSFIELKAKLEAEGLFERKRDLPLLPKCIGIATSESGAALHDMVTVIRRRFPSMNILFAPCAVQGALAPKEIIAAIKALSRSNKCDVIIVGRGGGSYEDLSCFNDEALARVIAASPIPIVSAVGHETDFTIADFAADLRAPTPSAAAELSCPEFSRITSNIEDAFERMSEFAFSALNLSRQHIQAVKRFASADTVKGLMNVYKERINNASSLMQGYAVKAVSEADIKNASVEAQLKSLDPMAVLKRGYAIVTDENGRFITSVSELKLRQTAVVRLPDGRADVSVIRTTSESA